MWKHLEKFAMSKPLEHCYEVQVSYFESVGHVDELYPLELCFH